VGDWVGVTYTATTADIIAALQNVTQFNIISAASPGFNGDQIAATIDYSNITAWGGAIPPPSGKVLYSVDWYSLNLIQSSLADGSQISSIPLTFTSGSLVFTGAYGLSKDPGTGKFYAVLGNGNSSAHRYLVTFDPTTGQCTGVGDFNDYINSIAFDSAGNLYGTLGNNSSNPGELVSISKSNAAMTNLVNDGGSPGSGLAFGPLDSKLYDVYGQGSGSFFSFNSPFNAVSGQFPMFGDSPSSVSSNSYELTASYYYESGFFLYVDGGSEIFLLSPSGYSKYLFSLATNTFQKGIVVAPAIAPIGTPTPVPPFTTSGLGKTVLGPVPAKHGDPICMYFDKQPGSAHWLIYNTTGALVSTLDYTSEATQCWATDNVSPGVYLAHVSVTYADGTKTTVKQKLMVTK
jgi:hypothetical protein